MVVKRIFSLKRIQVDPIIETPNITCEVGLTNILFTWDRLEFTDGYQVNVIDGPPGILLADTAYQINNLDPEQSITLEVIALTNNSCPSASNQITCTTLPCPNLTLNINPVADICFDANNGTQTLGFNVSGDTTGAIINWSGPGILDASSGEWQASADMIGQEILVILDIIQEVCINSDTLNINVFQQPEAAFTLTPNICANETATLTFTGTATDSANFNWDFGSAQIISGAGQGPYQLSFSNAGNYSISLSIEDNACTSNIAEENIMVDPLLESPEISCDATFTSLTFSWLPVDNATDYEVIVLQGPQGQFLDATNYSFDSLSPGEVVEIQVIAISDNACPATMSSLICNALPCPEVQLEIEAVAPICFEPNLGPIDLQFQISGDSPQGNLNWSGLGIIDAQNGTWQVTEGMIGLNNWVYLTYTEDICSYTDSILIEVNAIPEADFEVISPNCAGESNLFNFTGIADLSTAVFTWNFEDGSPANAIGSGPHEVLWDAAGDYSITLDIEQNGCVATQAVRNIEIDPLLDVPSLNCNADFNSIELSWDAVENATNYTLNISYEGNMLSETLDSNAYLLENLPDGIEVAFDLTVNSNNACPSVSVPITCSTIACPVTSVSLSAPEAICEGDPVELQFNFTGNSGPYDLVLAINTQNFNFDNLVDGATIGLDIESTSNISIVSAINQAASGCPVSLPADFEITVNSIVEAGMATDMLTFCSGLDTFILLADLVDGADLGGFWTETSAIPSTGNAFDANAGLFSPINQAPGLYTFLYTVEAIAPCESDSERISILIEETPVADAGQDMTIDCILNIVSIGGSGSSVGNNIQYNWTAANDADFSGNNQSALEVELPDIYTLEVINTQNGCSAVDEVIIDTDVSVLNPSVSISPISCFEANDGLIRVDSISGGAGPFSFALNDGAFSSQSFFNNLTPGNYVVTVRDAKGCEIQLEFDFDQPEQIEVRLITSLEGDPPSIELGDSIMMTALVNVPNETIDTLIWFPDSLNCPACFDQTVAPQTSSAYSVMVIDENGCTDSDNLTIFVNRERDIYIPNGFSPNNDGINDFAMIFGGQEVVQVNSFQIFNRWGEIVFEYFNFQPNNPEFGWNGVYNGSTMNPAVFVYYAEIEFIDGEVEIFKGDITLVR